VGEPGVVSLLESAGANWAEGVRQAIATQVTFLRPLAAAGAYAALKLLVGRALPPRVEALVALAASAWVLGPAWPAFVAASAIAYTVIWLAASSPRRHAMAMTWLVVLALVFVTARALGWDRQLAEVRGGTLAVFYLDMWMLLRLFTFTWEVGNVMVPLPGPARFAAWVASPLLLAGPLVRPSQWPEALVPDRGVLAPGRRRILVQGAAMIAGAVALAACVYAAGVRIGHDSLALKAASVLFVGPWAFYLALGGFFRVVEWLGAAAGVAVPESFRFPFFKSNIAAFWSCWNLTATGVFRDYLFYNRWGLRSYNVYANTIIVFLSVGLWHGSNLYWLCFGLLHGLYFCIYLWSRPRVARFAGRGWFETASVAVTYLAVCAAWYLPSKIALYLRG
jgi:hypothetical protein